MSENNDNSGGNATQRAPEGWYPDPYDPATQRYWDGARWTEHTAVRAAAVTPTQASPATVDAAAGGVAVAPTPKRGLPMLTWWQWALIALGVLVVISVIAGALGAARGSSNAADHKPATVAEEARTPSAEAAENEPEDTAVAVPEVVGKTVAEARTALEAAGFTLVVNVGAGDDWLILTQGPVGNQKAEPGTEVSVIAEAPKPVYTLAQENAIAKAQSYLDFAGFSRTGLIDQLEYEGFSTEDATFGADNAGADWNAEAAEKAASYLDFTSFSRQGLYDQLAYEGFTDAEIQFALAAVGY